jgi:hypothetical protein
LSLPFTIDEQPGPFRQVKGVLFLCKDDLMTLEELRSAEADADLMTLMKWWNENVAVIDKPLPLNFMKDLVSR